MYLVKEIIPLLMYKAEMGKLLTHINAHAWYLSHFWRDLSLRNYS